MRTVLNTAASTATATTRARNSRLARAKRRMASSRCTQALSTCTMSTLAQVFHRAASLADRWARSSPSSVTTMASGSGLSGSTARAWA